MYDAFAFFELCALAGGDVDHVRCLELPYLCGVGNLPEWDALYQYFSFRGDTEHLYSIIYF